MEFKKIENYSKKFLPKGKWSDGTFMDGEVTETKYGSGSICLV
jgi:hypothetical protein